jgi:hypothetical protein
LPGLVDRAVVVRISVEALDGADLDVLEAAAASPHSASSSECGLKMIVDPV